MQLQCGDTVKFYKTTGSYRTPSGTDIDFPFSEDWTMKYRVVGGSLATPVTATASEDSTGAYLITFAASDFVAQEVHTVARMIGWVEGTSVRYTIYDQPISLLPNVGTATATELETHSATMLRLINARLEGRMASGADFDSYGLAGRSVQKIPFGELLKTKGIYEAKVWTERNRGKAMPARVGAFVNAR